MNFNNIVFLINYTERFNDKKFNIVEVEKEVVRKSKVMLEEKKVKIEFNLSEEINVFADDFYIEQVISNYITKLTIASAFVIRIKKPIFETKSLSFFNCVRHLQSSV